MARMAQQGPREWQTVAHIWRSVRDHLFDPYRPELHYMRGPGPKWREKHGLQQPQAEPAPDAVPEAA